MKNALPASVIAALRSFQVGLSLEGISEKAGPESGSHFPPPEAPARSPRTSPEPRKRDERPGSSGTHDTLHFTDPRAPVGLMMAALELADQAARKGKPAEVARVLEGARGHLALGKPTDNEVLMALRNRVNALLSHVSVQKDEAARRALRSLFNALQPAKDPNQQARASVILNRIAAAGRAVGQGLVREACETLFEVFVDLDQLGDLDPRSARAAEQQLAVCLAPSPTVNDPGLRRMALRLQQELHSMAAA